MKKKIVVLLMFICLLILAGCSGLEHKVLLSYNENNGTVTINGESISYLNTSGRVEIVAKANDGFIFKDFYDLSKQEVLGTESTLVIDKLDRDYSIRVRFDVVEKTKYTITYKNHLGVVIKTEEVEEGKNATYSVIPQRLGYEFKGWDAALTNITENKTVSPLYELIQYPLKYELAGGSNNSNNPVNYNVESHITLEDPSKDGYTFDGWYYDNNYSSKIEGEIDVTQCKELVVYAKFNKDVVEEEELVLSISGSKLSWNKVTNATSYKVYVNSSNTSIGSTADNYFDLSNHISATGVYEVHVVAYGNNLEIISNKVTYILEDNAYTGTYYNDVDISNLSDSLLKSALRSLITSTHKNRTSYDDCREYVLETDGDPNNSKNVVLFYTGISRSAFPTDWNSNWNREHVWPQSKGWFKTSGAGSDLHHIRPSDPKVNGTRGNLPYGEVSGGSEAITSSANGSIKSGCFYSNGYFEPVDNVKGDCARIIFYLLVRYSESDSISITNVAKSMDMLLRWNELDPVDEKEIRRNEAVFKIQGNRNPFIDYSHLAKKIWG